MVGWCTRLSRREKRLLLCFLALLSILMMMHLQPTATTSSIMTTETILVHGHSGTGISREEHALVQARLQMELKERQERERQEKAKKAQHANVNQTTAVVPNDEHKPNPQLERKKIHELSKLWNFEKRERKRRERRSKRYREKQARNLP